MLPIVRQLLRASGLPYVIENVVGAKPHMEVSIVLHGGMFGLGVERRRLFESNVGLMQGTAKRPPHIIGVYGRAHDGRRLWGDHPNSGLRAASSLEEAQQAMGIDWMTWDEIRESIPPAYCQFIGEQLISQLSERAS